MSSKRRRRSATAADAPAPDGPQLDRDRTLALTYVPVGWRPALAALWRLDTALGAVLAGAREPMIGQIKLAWWRDSLERLDRERAPAEPVLQELAGHVLTRGISGSALSVMEEGWAVLLSGDPLTADDLALYASARGALLFRLSGSILGERLSPEMERAGEAWALVDLARHSNAADGASAMTQAESRLQALHWPSRLRPLGMLAALAARDAERGLSALEPQGAPARMLRMLRHRFSGR